MILFIKKHSQFTVLIFTLVLFQAILFFLTKSFTWSVLFSFGFLWNWVVGNFWVKETIDKKRYRFSTLRLMTKFHELFYMETHRYQIIPLILTVIPASILIYLIGFIFNSNLPWMACLLGSAALVLIQKEVKYILSLK